MKTKSLSLLTRIIFIVLFVLLLILLSIFLLSRFSTSLKTPTPQNISENLSPDMGQLQLVDQKQQMISDNYSLNGDLNAPAPMFFPLKSLADFPASHSATIATIKTNKGKLVIQLFPELVPVTVANFLALADEGYYNGLKFHRVESNFVAQIGDSLSRTASSSSELADLGTGYPGYRIIDEFSPQLSHDQVGWLSMANININGQYPNTGGSQFFFTLAPATHLDGRHAIFAKVTQGLEILSKLEVGDTIEKITF